MRRRSRHAARRGSRCTLRGMIPGAAAVTALMLACACSSPARVAMHPPSPPPSSRALAAEPAPLAPPPAAVTELPAAGPPFVSTGRIVFVDRDGAIVMKSLASDAEQRFVIERAAATDLMLSPDGAQLAFIAQRKAERTEQVMVIDLKSGAQRTIEHERAQVSGGRLQWAGDTLLFATYNDQRIGHEHHTFAVAPGASASRLVSKGAWLSPSPDGTRIVHVECEVAGDSYTCPQRLVVEAIGGSRRKVLARKGHFELVAFTPDGRSILTKDGIGSFERRLMRRDLDGTRAVDLGIVFPMHDYGSPVGPVVSESSYELIAQRATETVALRIDGTGERTIAAGKVMAGFLRGSDVLYSEIKDLGGYGDDVPNNVDSLWLLRGGQRTLLADFDHCGGPTLSRSLRLAARVCRDGVHIYSLETARELRVVARNDLPEPATLLGFDAGDSGLLVALGPGSALPDAEHELRVLGLDGRDRTLGVSHSHVRPNGLGTWPAFAFWPTD